MASFPARNSCPPPANELFSKTASLGGTSVDWKETPTKHVFEVELPGMKKDQVKVDVEYGRMLCISGEKKRNTDQKSDVWHYAERNTGKFQRK